MPARVARVEEGHDMRVAEARGDLDLAEEPLGTDRVRQRRVEDLERDLASVAKVVGEIDRGHAPASDLALDPVPPLDCGAERLGGGRGGGRRFGHDRRYGGFIGRAGVASCRVRASECRARIWRTVRTLSRGAAALGNRSCPFSMQDADTDLTAVPEPGAVPRARLPWLARRAQPTDRR